MKAAPPSICHISPIFSAIQKMKHKEATGPDNSPPTLLKSLAPLALLQGLLCIFNASFYLEDCPRIWKVAIIIPLLKAGKSPSDVASFRPISVSSCVVNLLECIIADQLYYIAESNNFFGHFQASFCKGRSCEDQILIAQVIEDGFQQRPMQHSVLTLLDFSKVYDTVWQEKLILCMLDACIPITFVRCLCSFLTDRRARVQLHNVCSSSRRFNQCLPQGSILTPLLFLFYINNLAQNLSIDAV